MSCFLNRYFTSLNHACKTIQTPLFKVGGESTEDHDSNEHVCDIQYLTHCRSVFIVEIHDVCLEDIAERQNETGKKGACGLGKEITEYTTRHTKT